MSERLQQLRNRITDGQSEWYRLVGNPYVRAYDTAFNSYRKEVENQAAADKERAEMFVMATSIVTGSVLMAAFASSSLRVLAGRAILDTVCSRNLNAVFNLMHTASNSKAFMFALGKMLDEGKSRATKVAHDAMTKVVQSNSNITSNTPLVQSTHIDDYLRYQMKCATAAAEAVEANPHLSAAEKNAQFTLRAAAPICNPPKGGAKWVFI